MQLFLVVCMKDKSEKMHSPVLPKEERNFNDNSTDFFTRKSHQKEINCLKTISVLYFCLEA